MSEQAELVKPMEPTKMELEQRVKQLDQEKAYFAQQATELATESAEKSRALENQVSSYKALQQKHSEASSKWAEFKLKYEQERERYDDLVEKLMDKI